MRTADQWINDLNLQPHPEGGFFKETYRSTGSVPGLSSQFPESRAYSTAILFLLRSQDRSVFHKIKSDEIWHFHDGSALSIYILGNDGVTVKKLGRRPDFGEVLQIVVPANHWFGAIVDDKDSFTLSGCTVSPGFDFQDFKMADRDQLLKEFPLQKEIILKLTR